MSKDMMCLAVDIEILEPTSQDFYSSTSVWKCNISCPFYQADIFIQEKKIQPVLLSLAT